MEPAGFPRNIVFAVRNFPVHACFLGRFWVEVGRLWYTIDFIKVNREDCNEGLIGW